VAVRSADRDVILARMSSAMAWKYSLRAGPGMPAGNLIGRRHCKTDAFFSSLTNQQIDPCANYVQDRSELPADFTH